MKTLINPALMGSFAALMLMAPADADGGADVLNISTGDEDREPSAEPTGEPTAVVPEKVNSRNGFTADQITEIRRLRSLRDEAVGDQPGKPTYSHKKLADMFSTSAGVISQIVRNRTYKDPTYTPIDDGK